MPQKANLSCWEASVENGEKTVPSDIIEMKGGNAAGFFDMKVTEISEPSAFIEGEDVPVVIDLTQRLYGDATHLDPRLQLSVYPDAAQFSFGWTTPAGDDVSMAMSQSAGEKSEGVTILWKRDNDQTASLKLPVGLNDNQVMGLVRSLSAMAQRVKSLGQRFGDPRVSREDVGQRPGPGVKSEAQP